MNIAIVYVFAPHLGGNYDWFYPARFLESYHKSNLDIDHQSVIVCNSPNHDPGMELLLSTMKNPRFLQHDNTGWDIGAFQFAGRAVNCDLMVFFGSSAYIMCPNWLHRVVESFTRHGDGIYGATANRGDIPVGVWPHIRTTAFWMRRDLFNAYPHRITQATERHPFEHGATNLTMWVISQGRGAWVVSTDGEYPQHLWDIPNGFQRGTQRALLAGDRMTEPPFYPSRCHA